MENLTGQVIKSYEMMERIGTGGFGAVYRAFQAVVEREVAIKIILPEHANHPDFIRRFETEAQLVARLEHPHIVPLYDYWREPNSAYLVMRYLRGGSLRDSIDANGAWDVRRVAQLINQIGTALAFAHQHGVVHRDLKSDNILIDEIGNAYLGDFGIAKDLGGNVHLTKDAILGTPAYLAPEQIRGETATPQSDIYALGIMIYEALTGHKPFVDMTPATVLFKQLNDPLPDIRMERPDLNEQLNEVLQRATAKDISQRYTDAIAFARDFQDAARMIDTSQLPSLQIGMAPVSITEIENENFQAKNPYKGLRAFQQADAGDFFGRDALVDRLLDRMVEDHPLRQFLAVIGPSGSGKSSLVKAGVLPHLRIGRLQSDADWFVIEMVPGTHPLEELEAALMGIASKEVPGLLNQLRDDDRGLVRAVKRILPNEDMRLILFIDQFEEIFTLVQDEADRVHFLNMILATINDDRSRISVIVTLRADFYDRPLLYGQFGELIRQRTELVLPLSQEELEESITLPAKQVGVAMESGLVNAIINDVSMQPGALPMLQYALTELFERRIGRIMRLETYHEIGGTSGALARRAEELYSGFEAQAQAATRQLFLRLVTLGDGTEDTRRRVSQAELKSLNLDGETIRNVIDVFGKYRLLTFDHDPQTRTSTVEVAHEALIRQWERLRSWLDENREGLRLQRQLTLASQEWLLSEKDKSYLAHGIRLQQFEDWQQSTNLAINETEMDYLKASIAEHENKLEIERQRQARERELEQRDKQRLRLVAAVMTVAFIISFILAAFAITQRQEAEAARVVAEENEAEAQLAREDAERQEAETSSLALAANARNALAANDPQLSLALALAAKEAFSPQPAEVLRVLSSTAYSPGPKYRLEGHEGSALAVSISPDGQWAVSAGMDYSLRLWDLVNGEAILSIDLGELYPTSVVYHPDGGSFFAALSDFSVRQYAVSDGAELAQFLGAAGMLYSVEIAPDGSILIAGGDEHHIYRWQTATGEPLPALEGHNGVILRLRYSADGSAILSSSADETLADDPNDGVDRTMRYWDAESGEERLNINPQSGFVRAIDISPDGSMIALGVWDSSTSGTVRIYDSNTGEEIHRLFAHPDVVSDIAFTPDNQFILSAGWDKIIQMWDIDRRTNVLSFSGLEERILAMRISPDGEHLVTGMGNVGNNIFSPETDKPLDASVWLWDLKTRDQVGSFTAHEDWTWAVDISPDGSIAATGGGPLRLTQSPDQYDLSVRIWDIDSGDEIQRLIGHTNTIDSVVFLPDGQRLLSAAWDGRILLWDLDSGEILREYLGHNGRVYKLALNSDGTRFASAGQDTSGGAEHIALLWDVDSGDILQTLEGHTGGVNGVAISPDDAWIATASSDMSIRIWDAASGSLLQTLEGHNASVNEVRFSPDGLNLVSSSWDDTVRLWDLETGREIRQFTGHTGNTFGLSFTNDGLYLLTTSQDTTMRMWEIASGEEIHRYEGHTDWVQEVRLSPDERFAITAAQDNSARIWHINRNADQLAEFAQATRYVRDLSCAERARYRLPLCQQES